MTAGAQVHAPQPAHEMRAPFATVLAFVEHQLRSLMDWCESSERPAAAFITVPAPRAPLDALLDLDDHAVLWDPPERTRYIGLGRAIEISGAGHERVAAIRERAATIWPTIARATYPGIEPLTPRFFGGFAFAPGAAARAPWSDFADGRFVLPTLLYAAPPALGPGQDREQARLALCVRVPGEDGAAPADARQSWLADHLAQLARALHRLASSAPWRADDDPDARQNGLVSSVDSTDSARWREHIRDIRAAIAARRCDKIVAARCRVLELARSIDHARVLGALERGYPDCYRFAFRFGGPAVFVGATPERLIECAGERISTQALAGSIAAVADSERTAAAHQLLASRKDRSEQDFVVRAIRHALEPLCTHLDVPAAPVIRELRDVLHLETPITGVLREPAHVLDLLALLHPTPAVGGVPTDVAVAWIEDNEPTPRGWYAAPVGHFDSRGHGEFAVAIRSGLLCGTRAHIYVGAGIVHDSDADKELAETQLKQSALLGALGVAD